MIALPRFTLSWSMGMLRSLSRCKISNSHGRHPAGFCAFTATTLLINLGFAFLIVKSCDWTVAYKVGLFQWIAGWTSLLLGIFAGILFVITRGFRLETWSSVPLSAFERLASVPGLTGSLSGRMDLKGTSTAPGGKFEHAAES